MTKLWGGLFGNVRSIRRLPIYRRAKEFRINGRTTKMGDRVVCCENQAQLLQRAVESMTKPPAQADA
jgi:hypothetical protein